MSDKINMSLDEIIKKKKESQKTQKKGKKDHVQSKQKPFKKNQNNKQKERKPKQKPQKEKNSEPSKTKLFVKGLNIGMTNNQLRDLFAEHGKMESCGINWDQLGRSRGTAQVEYKTAEEASAAIEKLNNTEVQGHTVTVVYFKSKE